MKSALLGLMAGTALLAGCGSLLPKPAPLPALHDFGPPLAGVSAPLGVLVTTDVTAPAWLDGTEIHYRLDYDDATRLRAYADNRWVAPPAALLQVRLRAEFGNDVSNASAPARAYRLNLRLLDLEQVFLQPQSAETRLRVVAELQDASSGVVVAKRVFDLTQAAGPDVGGAVQGASRATLTLVADLDEWLRTATGTPPPAGASSLR